MMTTLISSILIILGILIITYLIFFRGRVYIRIGDISENERSNIYNKKGEIIGKEIGVSVYETSIIRGYYRIIMPIPYKVGQGETYERLMKCINSGERKVHLVRGKVVGKGLDGEFLLRNVKVVKELIIKT